jgi:hypothetical protein
MHLVESSHVLLKTVLLAVQFKSNNAIFKYFYTIYFYLKLILPLLSCVQVNMSCLKYKDITLRITVSITRRQKINMVELFHITSGSTTVSL